ncbi:MAG: ROK family transcriptional regulator [Leptotrichiaceae bacterium]|nr:ROK family transcriptional regulator [Leptotrichiaceae bacterium]
MQEEKKTKISKLNKTDYQILERTMKNSRISRTDLSEQLELTPAAISKAIRKLISHNLIEEHHNLSSTGGRPRTVLRINRKYKKIVGINLGVGFISIAVSYLNGEILQIRERKFAFKIQEKVLDLLNEEISNIIEEFDADSIAGIGLATHGLVDRKKGTVIFSPHFKWRKLEIRKWLESRYNIPVIVENDVRAMLMAEHIYGRAGKMKNFILLYIRNGVGSAIFLNGKIFEGSNHGAGEIGHFIVKENSTVQCRCGKYGCLETEYSEQALINRVVWELEKRENTEIKEKITIDHVYDKFKNKEEPYFSIVKEAAYETGKVVGNILNVLDINDVIVSGDTVMAEKLFLDNFKKGVDRMILEEFNKKIRIVPSELSDTIGIYGAVSLITSNLFTGEKLLKIKKEGKFSGNFTNAEKSN